MGAIRSLLDIQGDLATEAAVASLIEDGKLQRHVARVYADRRDLLAGLLRRPFGDEVEFTSPSGGMALWVRFRGGSTSRPGPSAASNAVSRYTGRRYAFDRRPKPFARFNFAWLNERELAEAVRRMAAAAP